MKIKKEDLENILEDESTIEIEEYHTKHDCHRTVYVSKIEDKFYKFDLEFSYNEGIQLYDDYVDAVEVRAVEKTVVDWIEV